VQQGKETQAAPKGHPAAAKQLRLLSPCPKAAERFAASARSLLRTR